MRESRDVCGSRYVWDCGGVGGGGVGGGVFFFFNDTATTEIYTLSLHDALPICSSSDSVFIMALLVAHLTLPGHHCRDSALIGSPIYC